MWPALAELDGDQRSPSHNEGVPGRESPQKPGPTPHVRTQQGRWPQMARGVRAIKSFGGVRDKAPRCPLGPRQHGKLCRSTRSPVPGEPPEKVAGTLEAARNEKGRGRGAGAFLAQVRSGCGAGARHLAVVACRRSGSRFQGKGMNEHLVANVARWDRPVENWRHRFCSRAPLSLLSLEANAAVANVDGRHQLTSVVGLRFCLWR